MNAPCTLCGDKGDIGKACPKCGKQYAAPIPAEAREVLAELLQVYELLRLSQLQLDREWREGHIRMEAGILAFTCAQASQSQLGINAGVMRLMELHVKLNTLGEEIRRAMGLAGVSFPPPAGGMKH